MAAQGERVMSISSRKLAWTCQTLSTMLDAGLTVSRSLEVLEDKASDNRLQSMLNGVRQRVTGGATLREAFGEAGEFPGFLLNMISVGERSGRLYAVLEKAGRFYEMKANLRRSFISNIIFPALQYVVAVAIVSIAWYILNTIQGQPTSLTLHLLLGYGIPVVLYAAYLLFASYGVSARWVQEIILKIPVFGQLSSRLALARFSLAMHAMLEAGISAPDTLQRAFEATDNAAFRARSEMAQKVVKSGEPFTSALRRTGLFPEDYLSIMSVGEETGKLSDKMDWLAEHYNQKAEDALRMATKVAARLIWVLVALVIIAFVFQLFSRYISALQGVSNMQP